tara:strand:- start:384 stop:1049 length:666 start_codon:yes stop_codon:yes gene_type:complete
MNYEAEYQKLLDKKIEAGGFNPGYFEGDGFKTYTEGSYKQEFANTKKYNPKTKKFELFDTRTDKFYDVKEAGTFIKNQNKQANEGYFLEVFGTKTPEKDLQYLKAARDLERLKNRKGLLIYNIRDLASKKITGSKDSVFSKEFDQKIKKKTNELLIKKEDTSFIQKDNAQLEYKIDQSVKNQEEQPVNLKDLSVISPYVETRRKQLEIDKRFNTSGSGVTY